MRATLPGGTEFEHAPAVLKTGEDRAVRGLVIAADVGGLRPLFDEHCARLAAEHNWAVIAVEPFPGQQAMPVEERLSAGIDARRLTDDLVEASDVLRERPGVDRIAILGFCMGGMNAYRAAGTGQFDRAVSFYGMIRPPENWSAPGNDPLDALARPECCPVLAICGGVDRWTPPGDIAALRAVGEHVSVVVYDGADHGFVHDPSRPVHRREDAADAWKRVAEFLA